MINFYSSFPSSISSKKEETAVYSNLTHSVAKFFRRTLEIQAIQEILEIQKVYQIQKIPEINQSHKVKVVENKL